MQRSTILDVAREAGVSVSTVDRVLNGRESVREKTRARVMEAIAHLNYERDISAANLSKGRVYRLLFLLPEGRNSFMRMLETAVTDVAGGALGRHAEFQIEAIPAFDAAALAARLAQIEPGSVDGVALVATDGPEVRFQLQRLRQEKVKVVTLVSDLSASLRDRFVGIDNVMAGRTAAGLLGRFCAGTPGKIAIFVGSMLVRDHVERRLGFEQVLLQEFPHLTIGAVIEGRDDAGIVESQAAELLRGVQDLAGIYSLGAGNSGLIRAIQAAVPGKAGRVVAHELTRETREGLQSGALDAVINQDVRHEARSAVRVLQALIDDRMIEESQEQIRIDIFMRENLP